MRQAAQALGINLNQLSIDGEKRQGGVRRDDRSSYRSK